MIQIPLTNDPAQSFSIDLNDVLYDVGVTYNTRAAVWMLDLVSDDDALYGIALVSGVNLLQQHPFALDSLFLINLSDSASDPATDNLSDDFALVSLTDEEIAEVIS